MQYISHLFLNAPIFFATILLVSLGYLVFKKSGSDQGEAALSGGEGWSWSLSLKDGIALKGLILAAIVGLVWISDREKAGEATAKAIKLEAELEKTKRDLVESLGRESQFVNRVNLFTDQFEEARDSLEMCETKLEELRECQT